MTTNLTKKKCVKCVTGTNIAVCDGCHKSFCYRHLSEHRQELLQKMEAINDQCEHFRQNLRHEHDLSPILSDIDLWEKESIEKINVAANNARNAVYQSAEQMLNRFNEAVNDITKDIEFSRSVNDATEIDLDKWTNHLQTLKNLIKKPIAISFYVDESPKYAVYPLKVSHESTVPKSVPPKLKTRQRSKVRVESPSVLLQGASATVGERFHEFAGHVKVSENGLVAKFIGYSSIIGIKQYNTGVHRINFRIIDKRNEGIFFGILTSIKRITPRSTELQSVYGWRNFDRVIINSYPQSKAHKEKTILPGDEVTLTIDCKRFMLSLIHHRQRRKVQLSVDTDECPLPWKLLVSSYGEDVICIIH